MKDLLGLDKSYKFTRSQKISSLRDCQALVIPFWKTKKGVHFASSFPDLKSITIPALALCDFTGESGETLTFFPEELPNSRLVMLGLGHEESVTVDSLRHAFSAFSKAVQKKEVAHAAFVLPEIASLTRGEIVTGCVEGVLLSHYEFSYKQKKKLSFKLTDLTLLGATSDDIKIAEKVAHSLSGVFFARELVNRNADEITPRYLADLAKKLEKTYSAISVQVFDRKKLEQLDMGLILAVGRASSLDPCMIICEYRGTSSTEKVPVFVGKGVTFDTGGLNLKTDMLTMKCDMAGAASCLGLLVSAAESHLKTNFKVVIPAVENSIGSKSFKPGDVYKSYLGKTVEIGNTDAEGRLILADALAYAVKKLHPECLIDIATLTAAIVVALGHEVTGLFGNSPSLIEEFQRAGLQTGEFVHELPLIHELKEKLQSDIADIKNIGGRDAGSIKAALFLKEFTDNIPWIHLDIAGTAFRSEGRGYLPKYATGVGVRLFLKFLQLRVKQ